MELPTLINEADQLVNGAKEDLNIGEPKQSLDKMIKLRELLKELPVVESSTEPEAPTPDGTA